MGKPPIVIELTTNLRAGVTVMTQASAVPCPSCKSQNTKFVDGEIVCQETPTCGKKTKLV